MIGRVRRRADGMYEIELPDHVRRLLTVLATQLRELIVVGDATLQRLFPPAAPQDPEQEASYQRLMEGSLIEHRLAALDVLEESIEADELDEDHVVGWMQAVNSIRLQLGTALDVSEDHDEWPDPDEPGFEWYAAYELLGGVLELLVHAASGALPEPNDGGSEPPG